MNRLQQKPNKISPPPQLMTSGYPRHTSSTGDTKHNSTNGTPSISVTSSRVPNEHVLSSSAATGNTSDVDNLGTLLNREVFIKYIKRGTALEGSIRKLNSSSASTSPTRKSSDRSIAGISTGGNRPLKPVGGQELQKTIENVMSFLDDVCKEFHKCNNVMELFIHGVQQLHHNIHMVMSAFLTLEGVPSCLSEKIVGLQSSLCGDSNEDNDDSESDSGTAGNSTNMKTDTNLNKLSIVNLTKVAVNYTKEANQKCTKIMSQFVRLLDESLKNKYSEAEVMKLIQDCKELESHLFREVSSLERLCAESHNATEEAKHCMSQHKWKDHDAVKLAIAESRVKIRELKNTTDRALKENGNLEALRKTVNRDVEALVSARSAQERTEMHERLQKSLREMKMAHRILRERASNAQNNLQAVENVAKQIKELDPSDTWPLLRVPVKTNQTLCCLVRGPPETISHLKISYKKRNHSRHAIMAHLQTTLPSSPLSSSSSFSCPPCDQQPPHLLSDVIEIDNLATTATIQWPLIVCIPQKEHIADEKIRHVCIKWTTDPQAVNGIWNSEQPLRVNRQYQHKRYNLKGVFFTEVKITVFCSLAVVFNGTAKLSTSSEPNEIYQNHALMSPKRTNNASSAADDRGVETNTEQLEQRDSQIMQRLMNLRKHEMDVVLSDSFLLDLVSHFQEDWKKILIYLNVPITVIKMQEMNHPNSKIDVMLNCLCTWKSAQTGTANKLNQLKESFKRCKRDDLLEMLAYKEAETNLTAHSN